jgi:hypothetical protein
MATFHLVRTRSGKLLLTTEQTMRPEEMNDVAAYLQAWSEGPDTGVLVIPDCVFELEVVDDEITLVGPAVVGSYLSHPPVASEPESPVGPDGH